MVRTTQDDERENMQVELFNLTPLQGRSNKYIPDAILEDGEEEYFIEFKTSEEKRRQVSTARNVTLDKIDEWEKVWWVFSLYRKDDKGKCSLIEHYLGDKDTLREWFNQQRRKINEGTKTYGGLESWQKAYNILSEHMDDTQLNKLDHTFRKRGMGLNDPKISWSYIERNCIRLDDGDLASDLRRLVVEKNTEKKSRLLMTKVT